MKFEDVPSILVGTSQKKDNKFKTPHLPDGEGPSFVGDPFAVPRN